MQANIIKILYWCQRCGFYDSIWKLVTFCIDPWMRFFSLVYQTDQQFFGKANLNKNVTTWIDVLFAIIRPDTLWDVSTYGLFLLNATWMEAGPQSMKLAIFLYLTLWSDLWIWVASISPWMMLRIDMYFPLRVGALTIILLGWSNLLITSKTVVFLILDICLSMVNGV